MACYCKNPDGTLAEMCNGTCKSEIEKLSAQIAGLANQINVLPAVLSEVVNTAYKKGFTKGFEAAREIYE